ncbi:MAG TPA: hypothetical protein VN520_35795 [Streptomyces sp.]|uniref:hypothetical protein n=1 Tax=Streptomyces sp. TaxID=1931 RepID=UPI002B66BDF3|nr:hypothetical protein [Streptomyces sp.]HWU11656.1 hypothetical protein [Streptomyces sp.]
MSSSPSSSPSAPAAKPKPFLLTPRQGEAARTLLAYVCSLPLRGADAQLLAVVVAIRAARSGIGNLTGQDVRSLRLADPEGAVGAFAALGWQGQEALLGTDLVTPVGVTVPDLGGRPDSPLPFGKVMRSRVSGWTARTLSAKPVKKTSTAARLAALFLSAHGPADEYGTLPAHLPDECRAALPELLAKQFLRERDGDRYLLAEAVRHLSGMRPLCDVPPGPRDELETEELTWDEWKDRASTALRRHVEAVEGCPECSLSTARVSEAFMRTAVPAQFEEKVYRAYGAWQAAYPDQGPAAAEFAASFRAAHGHGPSVKQLCTAMGWGKMSRELRIYVIRRLIVDGWLMNTDPVPWTLRPGKAAQGGTSGAAAPTGTAARLR